jgi:hypothetical protein
VKKILWLFAGVGVGFVAAHQISKTSAGKKFFDDVNAKAHDFSDAVVDGYKQREAELRAAIDDIN